MMEHEIVTPDASPVIQSLRAIGYIPESAIADIIDNSLDAKAKTVKIDMVWAGEGSFIRIEDDGHGMDESTLVKAMRIGSKNPLQDREQNALGRFGMGLKTASFSLGKRLTVMTKAEGTCHYRCWDLEVISKTNEWTLLKSPIPDSVKKLGEIKGDSGTVVLIESLDRLISPPHNRHKQNKFYRQIDSLEKHLRLVFHRFLEGSNRISMTLNGNVLVAWDPFLAKNLSTIELPLEQVRVEGQLLSVQAFVLPHHSRLTKNEYVEAGGISGWYDHQGYYVYRNKRLLVGGNWLGIFQKEESAKLARIRVDIDNKSDFDWQIDVKKSVARPPHAAIEPLKRIAEKAREMSHKVFYSRGAASTVSNKTKNAQFEVDYVWDQTTRKNKPYYLVYKNNPLLERLRTICNDEARELLDVYLKLVQEYCPANTISYLPSFEEDVTEAKVIDEHRKEIIKVYEIYKTIGMLHEVAIENLRGVPMFSDYSCDQIRMVIQEGCVD